MTSTPCPSCHTGQRGPGKYLCGTCWFTLAPATRRALSRSDTRAMARLQSLYNQLATGVPLDEIQVMA